MWCLARLFQVFLKGSTSKRSKLQSIMLFWRVLQGGVKWDHENMSKLLKVT